MVLLNKKGRSQLSIEKSLLPEEDLFDNIDSTNLMTFKGLYEELRKLPEDISMNNVGIFDFETTHFNGRAISMGYIIYSIKTNEVLASYYWEFKNPVPIDPESFKVHGLSEEDLKDKPSFLELYNSEIRKCIEFCDCSIAHNSDYDVSVLGRELYTYGLSPDFEFKVIDSGPLLKKQIGDRKYNLEFCADHFGVKIQGETEFHNALYDCKVLTEVIKKAIHG